MEPEARQASLRDWSARASLPGGSAFVAGDGFVSHPLLAPHSVEHRAFQVHIAERALRKSSLVVLPTGLGKTVIAVLVAAEVLRRGERVLLLAPTRPLAVQHHASFTKMLPDLRAALFTGSDGDRPAAWAEAQAVFATPQGLGNDLDGELYSLQDVGLIIFDEAHRAVGDYSYVAIAARYRQQRQDGLVLGLTASPGARQQRIDDVVRNLGIANVESRVAEDADVRDHVKDIDVEWAKVSLPAPMRQGQKLLSAVLREQLKEKPGKSDRVFLKDPRVQEALEAVKDHTPSHPKLTRLVTVLREELEAHPAALCIVFAQYRDTIDSIQRALGESGIPAERFVGQATRGADKGMSQAVQAETLARFRRGAFRVLVASSVAEEGLDIPQVDLVVFYEPVVSEIRAIQRRGRTGRAREGRVVVLVAQKTRDEAYAQAERRREEKMHTLVRGMGDEASEQPEFAVDPEEPA
ncbi:MAG: DEAD/DEAH box helicase family protein [Halobacteriales archaeon]|nr:DEAD/DEAH box helicase family protein [Halobacteriales archaeon]